VTTTPAWPDLARDLTASLRATGAIRTDPVADAICAVPRHQFISGHYATGQHTTVDPDAPTTELLQLAYADRGIMTHIPTDQAGGYSSTSQPAVVAKTLEAAELEEGMRVLEIGAGTGWNAALIAHITGADVHTVEASSLVADEARASLARAGAARVTVHTADGYNGHPDAGKYDRIVVTCGIAGIPPAWLSHLTPDGTILAPIAHGGMHPLMRITSTSRGARGQLVATADFMIATGALYAGATPSPSTLGRHLPAPTRTRTGDVPADLELRTSYADLWMYLAARDSRTTCASVKDTTAYTGCALVADDTTAVYVQPGGLHLTPGPAADELADRAAQHTANWDRLGRPHLTAWTCSLGPTDTAPPLLTPTGWQL